MPIQQVDAAGLTVVAPQAPSTPSVWLPGTAENGLDGRLELTRMEPGTGADADAGDGGPATDQVAVRDAQHPAGPVLLFSLPKWNALLGREPDLVDLR
jgi:hypothetical protein